MSVNACAAVKDGGHMSEYGHYCSTQQAGRGPSDGKCDVSVVVCEKKFAASVRLQGERIMSPTFVDLHVGTRFARCVDHFEPPFGNYDTLERINQKKKNDADRKKNDVTFLPRLNPTGIRI